MNIVIIEQNKVFRESLKTALNQVNGFKVVFDSDNCLFPEAINKVQVNELLLDYSFGEVKCNETIAIAHSIWPAVSILFLTNYKEEGNYDSMQPTEVILKSSSKKEFEDKIKAQQPTKNEITNDTN
jgi:DNA-binding NarL/FixJ family response regulator